MPILGVYMSALPENIGFEGEGVLAFTYSSAL